ncbi:MAG: galactokinase [Actinomycetota bacterium]|nr:galactokinase [Actinomycetota bacterium]
MKVFAPGRVNLIGDHTDYAGGLVLPIALQLGTTIEGARGGDRVELTSDDADEQFSRFVDAVVAEAGSSTGFRGSVTSTLPIGAGLSSSASLEVAVALAIGATGDIAALCQRAEQRASGVPCGRMDQLASVHGRAGHALLIDCSTFSIRPVPMPDDIEIVVVHSGESRSLASSAYAERRAQLEAGDARRVRHVTTENQRVVAFADALESRDLQRAGALMVQSHASLRDDFEVSTPALDALVEELVAIDGVHGARLTGAGFGGCVVALTEPGAVALGWKVTASSGAQVLGD